MTNEATPAEPTIVVSGVFEVSRETLAEALEAAREMAAASRAEPGCISYEFFADLEDSCRMRVFEEWQNQQALDEHFATEHMAHFRRRLSKVDVRSREIKRYVVAETTEL